MRSTEVTACIFDSYEPEHAIMEAHLKRLQARHVAHARWHARMPPQMRGTCPVRYNPKTHIPNASHA
jgi:hypothetical protein